MLRDTDFPFLSRYWFTKVKPARKTIAKVSINPVQEPDRRMKLKQKKQLT